MRVNIKEDKAMEETAVTLLKSLLVATIALLAPIHSVIMTVGFLIFMDLFTGMMAARKRLEPITSSAMRRTVSKMIIYQIAILSAFFCETYLLDGILPVAKLVAGAIGMVELTSVLENGNAILGTNIFKVILKRLGSKNDRKGN
jgi:hypothetical protein